MTPELRKGMCIDVPYKYSAEANDSELLMWYQGLMQQVSNRDSVAKDGGRYHKKKGVLVR